MPFIIDVCCLDRKFLVLSTQLSPWIWTGISLYSCARVCAANQDQGSGSIGPGSRWRDRAAICRLAPPFPIALGPELLHLLLFSAWIFLISVSVSAVPSVRWSSPLAFECWVAQLSPAGLLDLWMAPRISFPPARRVYYRLSPHDLCVSCFPGSGRDSFRKSLL